MILTRHGGLPDPEGSGWLRSGLYLDPTPSAADSQSPAANQPITAGFGFKIAASSSDWVLTDGPGFRFLLGLLRPDSRGLPVWREISSNIIDSKKKKKGFSETQFQKLNINKLHNKKGFEINL